MTAKLRKFMNRCAQDGGPQGAKESLASLAAKVAEKKSISHRCWPSLVGLALYFDLSSRK